MTKKNIYWLCQLLGWGMWGALQVILYSTTKEFDTQQALGETYQVIFYIATTHLFRRVILSLAWLNLRPSLLIPRLLIATWLLSVLNYAFLIVLEYVTGTISPNDFAGFTIALNTLGYWFIYFLWTMFYFAFHYIERYNKSLQAASATTEIELQNLKAQLNPHFMFNALNSIRALVDENPLKAKESITQLSHLLRNSLDSNRKKLVPFAEELKLVMDYLSLESTRYEERLSVDIDVADGVGHYLIPPLMVQTLVENGIKHGISKLKDGGRIAIQAEVAMKHLQIQIRNSGQLSNDRIDNKGLGLSNTVKRLNLLFGTEASFIIENETPENVISVLKIPIYKIDNSPS